MKEILEGYQYEDFLACLDDSWKTTINALDQQNVPLEIIGNEISNMPSVGLSTKGVNNWDKGIFQKVLSEVAKLICDETNENDIVKQLKSEAGITKQIIIAAFSSYVGEAIGFAAALCTPFVILAIAVVLKAGLNVFCQQYNPQ